MIGSFSLSKVDFKPISKWSKGYPSFGSVKPGRNYTSNDGYRFGFNGKEKDKESFEGCIAFEARIFDSRIGRFLNTDPLQNSYSWQTPYAYFSNSPIYILDWMGLGGTPDKNTGTITAKFVFVNNGVSDKDFLASSSHFKKNVESNFDGHANHNGKAVKGNFIFDNATEEDLATCYKNEGENTIFVYINEDKGQRCSAAKGGNRIDMNVTARDNIPTHEFMHSLGLSDRYHIGQRINQNPKFNNGCIIEKGFDYVPMALTKEEDADYFGNEKKNMMGSATGTDVTKRQWDYVFSQTLEPEYGVTTIFLQSSRKTILEPTRVMGESLIYYYIDKDKMTAFKNSKGYTGFYHDKDKDLSNSSGKSFYKNCKRNYEPPYE